MSQIWQLWHEGRRRVCSTSPVSFKFTRRLHCACVNPHAYMCVRVCVCCYFSPGRSTVENSANDGNSNEFHLTVRVRTRRGQTGVLTTCAARATFYGEKNPLITLNFFSQLDESLAGPIGQTVDGTHQHTCICLHLRVGLSCWILRACGRTFAAAQVAWIQSWSTQ